MFDRSPLSVVVPEKNPCFYSFKSNLPEVNFTVRLRQTQPLVCHRSISYPATEPRMRETDVADLAAAILWPLLHLA
jgi:hypothetical protein